MINMHTKFVPFTFLLVLANVAKAGVLPRRTTGTDDTQSTPFGLSPRDATPLPAEAVSAIAPFANFATAAYCPSHDQWNCGSACSALPNFEVTLTGGDGNGTQLFYVGYWSEQKAVVVAHQGTNPHKIIQDLTDINFFKKGFNGTLFPGIDSDAQGHEGFLEQHSKTANMILPEVKRLISSKETTTVMAIGHSLGGALAELDSLAFALNLPSNIHVKGVTFGTPRVGNSEYAKFFDSHVNDFQRINNKKDPVPTLPGEFLGFSHVHGEIHIVSDDEVVACSGDDDDSDALCTVKTVPYIFEGTVDDHFGPYDGVMIGSSSCK